MTSCIFAIGTAVGLMALAAATGPAAARSFSAGAPAVQVQGYTRGNGTYVHAYARSWPGARTPLRSAIAPSSPVGRPSSGNLAGRTPPARSSSGAMIRSASFIPSLRIPAGSVHRSAKRDNGPYPIDATPAVPDAEASAMGGSSSANAIETAAMEDAHWCDAGEIHGGFCVLK